MHKSTLCVLLFSVGVAGVFAQLDPTTFSDEGKELMNSLRSTCVKATEVDEELIKKASIGEFSDDTKFKCYTKCVLKECAVINEKGELDFDTLGSLVPMAEETTKLFKKATSTCGKQPIEEDLCERSWQFLKCLQSEMPDDFYLP